MAFLQFRSKVQKHPIGFQGDLILHECAEELANTIGGNECSVDRAHRAILGIAIPNAPNQIMTGAQGQVMLEIKIISIASLIGVRPGTEVPVEIDLQRHV